jgi:gluconate 2-dehydrogenase gamma chain
MVEDVGHGSDEETAGEERTGPPGWRASRRELFRYGGATGLALGLPAAFLEACGGGSKKKPSKGPAALVAGPRESLSAQEAATLEAVLERLIPTDSTGPGAREALVWRYIDRSLAHDYKEVKPLYSAGLAATDAYAKSKRGKAFAELTPTLQDAVVADIEAGKATGFPVPGSAGFFQMVWEHTLEGMFGDPYHGGNQNFVGWDLLDFPGIRLFTPASAQMIDVKVPKAHKSTDSFGMFSLNKED